MGNRIEKKVVTSLMLIFTMLAGLFTPFTFYDVAYANDTENVVEGFYRVENGQEVKLTEDLKLGDEDYGKDITVKVKYKPGVDFSNYMLEVRNPGDLKGQVLNKINENKKEQTITFNALQKGQSAILVRTGPQAVIAEHKVIVETAPKGLTL